MYDYPSHVDQLQKFCVPNQVCCRDLPIGRISLAYQIADCCFYSPCTLNADADQRAERYKNIPLREQHLCRSPHETSSDLVNFYLHMNNNTPISHNSQSAAGSQSAKLNRSAAQRRYRKKEGQGFLQLRQALKKVSKDDPRSKQDILKRGIPLPLTPFS